MYTCDVAAAGKSGLGCVDVETADVGMPTDIEGIIGILNIKKRLSQNIWVMGKAICDITSINVLLYRTFILQELIFTGINFHWK